MSDLCDQCNEHPWTRTVRVPRPSDPHDLCWILSLCDVCAPESSETCRTEAEWDAYMETTEAVAAGHWWLT